MERTLPTQPKLQNAAFGGTAPRLRWATFCFLGVLLILRWVMSGHFELSPDEAYYLLWSERPAPSYYSKGPGVAWAIGLGSTLFGKTEFGVRFLSPLLALGTALLVYGFQRTLWGEKVALWTVLTLACVPIFAVGGLLMTIDPISVFFWMATLPVFWYATRAPREKRRARPWLWLLAGVLIGLGFLAKYTNAFLLLSFVLYLAIHKDQRFQLLRPRHGLLWLGFLGTAWPPVLWNAQHDWITLTHLTERGDLDEAAALSFSPLNFLEYFGMHMGVYSPLIFLGILGGIWWGIQLLRKQHDDRAGFLLSVILPILVLYFGLSFNSTGEPNWTVPGVFTAVLLAVPWALERVLQDARWAQLAGAALALGLLMGFAVINSDALRMAGVPWPYHLDPSARLRGWQTAAEEIDAIRMDIHREAGEEPFLIGKNYQIAAILGFYLNSPQPRPDDEHPPVYQMATGEIQTQFSFWPTYTDPPETARFYAGRNALYITDQDSKSPPEELLLAFDGSRIISIFEIRRRGQVLRRLQIFYLKDFQPHAAAELRG